MTSNSSCSNSTKTRTQAPLTSDKLLGDLQKLRLLVEVLREPQWERLEEWLQVERQEHLEASVDLEDRDKAEYHRTIARWLKHFLGVTKDYVIEASKVKVGSPNETGENPYVETSSAIDEEDHTPFT